MCVAFEITTSPCSSSMIACVQARGNRAATPVSVHHTDRAFEIAEVASAGRV